MSGIKLTDDTCKITIFSSPCGGAGTSTVCAAYAMHLASQGKKVMYLNFEDFGSTDNYFMAEGQFDMSDVIFAIKSKKANIAMKLESYVKNDPRGVSFFSNAKFSLDMLEFSNDERLTLIDEIKMMGAYDNLVIDMSFGLDKAHMKFYEKAHNVVMVCDGNENSDFKIRRVIESLTTIDQGLEAPIANRFSLVYNRFSSKSGRMIEENQMRILGGAPVFANATVQQIIGQLYTNEMFDQID